MHSSLAKGLLTTSNCSKPRNHMVDTITPHYMACYATAKACCQSFVPSARRASANYCIGYDGEIWCNVEEENRAWTSSSASNDNRAITIECANYTDNTSQHVRGQLPYKTWDSLVKLCVDICRRYGKSHLLYNGRADYTSMKSTDMLLTMHKWFGSTDCPGPWLSDQFSNLAMQVTSALGGTPTPSKGYAGLWRVNVDGLRVRTQPNLSGKVVASYSKGQTVQLEEWHEVHDGYSWGRYTGEQSGMRRYIAIGRYTGKVEPTDFLTKIG